MALTRGLVALVAVAFGRGASAKGVHVTFKSGPGHSLGVFFMGNVTNTLHHYADYEDYEALVKTMPPDETHAMDLQFDHAFMVRSSDHQFRALVTVKENLDEKNRGTYPFWIAFKNLMQEQPEKVLALEHTSISDTIKPGRQVGLLSDVHHWYELRIEDELKISAMFDHATSTEL